MVSYPPQLHVARYDWVFILAISSQTEAFGLLLRLNDDDLHLVSCRHVAKSYVSYGIRERPATRNLK